MGLTWDAPLPPKMCLIETAAHLARWSGWASSVASPMLCSASGAAYISGPEERLEVRFDTAGACFRPLAHMGRRVRRHSAQSRAAESRPGAPLLRAGGEKGHARGRQRLRLAG